MAQSHGQCGGNCEALVLLKASIRSTYSGGTGGSACDTSDILMALMIIGRIGLSNLDELVASHRVIYPVRHEIYGLWFCSQGKPRMTR